MLLAVVYNDCTGRDGVKAKFKYFLPAMITILLAPLGLLLQSFFFSDPGLTEEWYSAGIYPLIAKPISIVTGLLPFSLAELIVVTAPVWAFFLFRALWRASGRHEAGRALRIVYVLARTAGLCCAGYFIYLCLCGFNYARLPYSKIAGYDDSPAEPKLLHEVCSALAHEANLLRAQIPDSQKSEPLRDVISRSRENYRAAAEDAPWLGGNYGPAKQVLLSEPWARTQTVGMFFPYTLEANINRVNSPFMFASTIAHEAAHQRGFMREDEANFIAWYVCMHSQNTADRYSGTLLALIHTGNALAAADPDLYGQLYQLYSPKLRADLAEHNELWAKYEGKAAEISQDINNAYLESNRQEDGVRSYGRMVNLLIGYYRENGTFRGREGAALFPPDPHAPAKGLPLEPS